MVSIGFENMILISWLVSVVFTIALLGLKVRSTWGGGVSIGTAEVDVSNVF